MSSKIDTSVLIEADTDDDDEFENPFLRFPQGGGTVGTDIGSRESAASNTLIIEPQWSGSGLMTSFSVQAQTGRVGIGHAVGGIEGIAGPGISLNKSGADYAEFVRKQDPEASLKPGQVVGIHEAGASLVTDGANRVMVVSESPAVVGNRPLDGDETAFVKVAFVGVSRPDAGSD